VSLVASEVQGLVVELLAREGRSVSRGEALASLRRRPLELRLRAAEAELKEARARRELAATTLERARDLREDLVVSQQDLDDALAEYAAWEGRVERLEATIEDFREDLERSTIRAPFDGVVVAEHVEVGEWVDQGDPVVELVALDRLEVLVNVPERYFAGLSVGEAATLRFEALGGVTLTGHIKAIVPRADPEARSFPVRISLAPEGHAVGVGMLAEVTLAAGESYPAVVVPKDAVVQDGRKTFLFVILEDGTVERRDVRPGGAAGDRIAIPEALRAGERVVVRGNERLLPGDRVAGRPLEEAAR
jgi:RND family efflux transporter MFP subunit